MQNKKQSKNNTRNHGNNHTKNHSGSHTNRKRVRFEDLLDDDRFDDEDADSVTEDTLEFLSLDDDMIASYQKSHSAKSSKSSKGSKSSGRSVAKKPSRPSRYERDYDDYEEEAYYEQAEKGTAGREEAGRHPPPCADCGGGGGSGDCRNLAGSGCLDSASQAPGYACGASAVSERGRLLKRGGGLGGGAPDNQR